MTNYLGLPSNLSEGGSGSPPTDADRIRDQLGQALTLLHEIQAMQAHIVGELAIIKVGLGLDVTSEAAAEACSQVTVAHPFPVEPGPDEAQYPMFTAQGREMTPGMSPEQADWPVISTCRCGRQIACLTADLAGQWQWQHSD